MRHGSQLRSDVLVHVAADVLGEQRIGHGFVDEAITAQEAEVGQRGWLPLSSLIFISS